MTPETIELEAEPVSEPLSVPSPSPAPIPTTVLEVPDFVNVAWIEGAYRPLLGRTGDQRRALVTANGLTKIYSSEILRNAAAPPTLSLNLPAGADASMTWDYSGDGIPDILSLSSSPSSTLCGNGSPVQNRFLKLFSGSMTGPALLESGSIPDVCLSVNGGATQAYPSLHRGALQFGGFAKIFALSPQYQGNGWFFWNQGGTHFWNAETSNFASYLLAKIMLQPSALGRSYARDQQPLNGLMLSHGGGVRYVATTSGRFLKYSVGDFSNQQLMQDSPFLARTDLVGRNYGLLQHDHQGNPEHVLLINGAQSSDLAEDFRKYDQATSVQGSDLWGGIERHVSLFHLSTGVVHQRFISYAHDQNDGKTYRDRITVPPLARLPSFSTQGSKMAFNVFDGKTWNIHITSSGGVASQIILSNQYLWDIIPVSAGIVDLVISPIDLNRLVLIPDYMSANGTIGSWRKETYFPQMKTQVYRWEKAQEQLVLRKTWNGGIPLMNIALPHTATEANGTGSLFPTLRSLDRATGQNPVLILRSPTGEIIEAALN